VRRISILILCTLIVQLSARYASPLWVTGHFYWIPFLARLGPPLVLAFFILKLSSKDLLLGLPQMSRVAWVWTIVALIVIPLVVSFIRWDPSYLAAYPQYTNDEIPAADRLERFGLFTLSTFFSWALIHRGFLLGGMRRLLIRELKISESAAAGLAILWTTCFEVLYHLIKPGLEAWGLLIFSPLLSYLALKTRSLWLPTLLHLYLELCFILTLVFLV
jgi:hypothetical protein